MHHHLCIVFNKNQSSSRHPGSWCDEGRFLVIAPSTHYCFHNFFTSAAHLVCTMTFNPPSALESINAIGIITDHHIGTVGGWKHRPLASTCLLRCFLKLVITAANTSLFSASILYPMEGFFGTIQ